LSEISCSGVITFCANKAKANPNNKKKAEFANKIRRIWTMLNFLDKGGRIYTEKMARELNVSKRTIQRDIKIIEYAGFRIERCNNMPGAYRFEKGFRLGKIMITREEAAVMALLSDMFREFGDEFSATVRGLRKKMEVEGRETPFYFKVPQIVKAKAHIAYFSGKAIVEHRRIIVEYESRRGREVRKVDPHTIYGHDGFLYLVVKERGRKGFLKFRMDKINSVKVLNEKFVPKKKKCEKCWMKALIYGLILGKNTMLLWS
jgi:predicted DNA-binding transcriptional regulator YafY